ncbi:hypothetical protein D5086_005269 [Populus alba]|uniref:Uncharacterized protein n=1 Tax=Populus alba TaxID=43335 RepID=A0ACC4CSV2_POPAL
MSSSLYIFPDKNAFPGYGPMSSSILSVDAPCTSSLNYKLADLVFSCSADMKFKSNTPRSDLDLRRLRKLKGTVCLAFSSTDFAKH